MKTEKLLSVDEASKLVGLKPSTLRRKILERKIAFVKLGKAVRIPIEAINEMVELGWRSPIK